MPVTKSLSEELKLLSVEAKQIKVTAEVKLSLSTPIISPYPENEIAKLLPIKSIAPWCRYFVYAYATIAYPKQAQYFSFDTIQSLDISINGRSNFVADGSAFKYLNGSDDRQAYKLVPGTFLTFRAQLIVDKQCQKAVNGVLTFALESFWLWFSTGLVKSKGFGQFEPHGLPTQGLDALVNESCQIGHLVTFAKHKCLGQDTVNYEHQIKEICETLDTLIVENFGKGSNGFLVPKARAFHKVFTKKLNIHFSYNDRKESNKYLENILKQRMLIKPDERTKDGRIFLSLLREYLKSKKLPDDIKPFLVRHGKDLGVASKPLYALGREDRFEESWDGDELNNIFANQNTEGRPLFYRALFGMPEYLEYMVSDRPYTKDYKERWGYVKFTFDSDIKQLFSAVQYKSILGQTFIIGYPTEVYLPKNREVTIKYQTRTRKEDNYKGFPTPEKWKYSPIMLPNREDLQGFGVYSFMKFLEKRNFLK